MREIKLWPHLTVVAVVCALIAGLAVGFWMKKRNEKATAETVLTAGRIQQVDGEVAVNDSLASNEAAGQWYQAEANTPFSVGDRIYTRNNSQASLAFTGRNFARLNPNSSIDILSLDRQHTQLALRDGSALFDVGYLEPGNVFEVATPRGAVDFYEPGLYDIGIGNDGNVIVSVLSGLAQVVGLGGSGQISKGEVLTLLGQTAAEIALSRIDGRRAGYLVDDYYRYQYPNYYDGRYRDYNVYLDDPYYFDPYRRNVSYQYASPYIPGLHELDYYGSWQNINGYGYAWTPRVNHDWAPYQQGYWINDYPYGPTWVSTEPWGYAPYHYGRWTFVNDRWYWIPDGVNSSPLYSPALVAFVPSQQDIAWVPLAPGEPYAPRYYDASWNPYYLSRADINPTRVVNLGVPGAIAALPVDDFFDGFEGTRVRRRDRRDFGETRTVLDPLTLTPLRNAVVRSAWGRGKIDLPPGIAKKLDSTRVFVSREPVAPPFRSDFVRRRAVATVPEDAKQRKFKARDQRPGKHAARVVPEERDEPRVSERGNSGNDLTRREERRVGRERVERENRGQTRRAEGERVANPAVERRSQPARRAQPEPRRAERPSARPDRPQQRPAASARPRRQQDPRVQFQGPPVREQRPQVRERRSGPPARVEQRERRQRVEQPSNVRMPQSRPQARGQQKQPARVQPQQTAPKTRGSQARTEKQGGAKRAEAPAARQGGRKGKGKG